MAMTCIYTFWRDKSVGVSQWVRVKLGEAEHANYFGAGPKEN